MSAKAEAVQIQYPLRERRKRRTRAALIEAAVDLFSSKGYDDTTLEEVADRAGLHVQTLYRHFPSKPELAVAVDRQQIEEFRVAIEDPDRSDTTFEFWRERIILVTSGLKNETDGYQKFRALVLQQNRSPSIALRLHTVNDEYEDLLTASLAKDFRMDASVDRLPRLVACMLVAGNRHAYQRWAHEGGFDLIEEVLAVADEVAELFRGYVVATGGQTGRSATAAGA